MGCDCEAEDASEEELGKLGALQGPRSRFECLHFGSTATFPGAHPLPRGSESDNVQLRGNSAQLGTFTGFYWLPVADPKGTVVGGATAPAGICERI